MTIIANFDVFATVLKESNLRIEKKVVEEKKNTYATRISYF